MWPQHRIVQCGPGTNHELSENADAQGVEERQEAASTPPGARPRKTMATAEDAWGLSGQQAWPGQTRDMKATVVPPLRLTVHREVCCVFSGAEKVLPSTYCAMDWCKPRGEPGEGLRLRTAALPAPLASAREKDDVSYFN